VPGLPAPPPAADPVAHRSAEPPDRDAAGKDPTWRNPAIGRPLAIALALLAVIVAIAVILFVVLNRIKGATAGLVAPQSLVEAWWTYLGPLF
jgi:hypothetical protein